MDVSQYLGVFLDEAKEHLQTLNDSIMQLEQDPNNEDCINEIFRAAHSMKGMAGTMGYKRMQQLTHDIEDVFSDIRNGTLKVNGNIIDTLFQCLDAVQAYVDNIGQTQDEGTEDNAHLIQALANIRAGGAGVDEQKTENAPAASENVQETVHTADAAVAYQEIRIDPDMKAKLEGDLSDGKKVYGITVHIMESCVLKAARAFLVLKGLEEIGEIALCEPSMQDIEDEKFDTTFSLLLVTEDTIDHVRTIAEEVSEIQKVDVGDYDVKNSKNSEDDSHAPAPAAQASKQAANVPVPQPKSPAADRNTPPVKKPAGKSVVSRTIRVDIEKLDSMMNLVSELIIAKNSLISTTQSEELSNNAVNERIEYLESVTTNLHESVMKVRMVPIENALQKFPRMIRDLNKSLGKKMELTMTGEDTEMDRTVVDEIGDPLMHLLRNSADHGIETPDVRSSRGKPEVGQIFLHAYQDGNSVVIEVGDDGNGIDADVVKAKAIEKGVVTPEQAEALTEQQCVELLFHPGFSTAKNVSEISGRGVGLDVVKSKVESLSGEVSVKTKQGEGSTWVIRLPMTLAIIQALMVVVGGEKYAIPLDSIQTIEDVNPKDVEFVSNKEVITLRGSVCPLIRLSEALDCTEAGGEKDENKVVVIVRKKEQQFGLVIDQLIGQLEIVIKPLGKYTGKTKLFSGATILGDGEVALILDTNSLV